MKIIICGGSGQVGTMLIREFQKNQQEVVLLSRNPRPSNNFSIRTVFWDGATLGPWAEELNGADVVINLAGRSVNCRYTKAHLIEMMQSRVQSTQVVGQAISQAQNPPKIWLQMSTATIYAHTLGPAHDEETGIIGGNEANVPRYWDYSVEIAKAWEHAQVITATPKTRKIALRTAMVMSPDKGGVFDMLYQLTRFRLGGAAGDGKQFVSWIHEQDFIKAISFLIQNEQLTGPINVCSPCPLPQKELMAAIRKTAGISIGLPATKWMLELGAFFLRTDTELLLKSRRVIPGRLLQAGFSFQFADWPSAVKNLINQS